MTNINGYTGYLNGNNINPLPQQTIPVPPTSVNKDDTLVTTNTPDHQGPSSSSRSETSSLSDAMRSVTDEVEKESPWRAYCRHVKELFASPTAFFGFGRIKQIVTGKVGLFSNQFDSTLKIDPTTGMYVDRETGAAVDQEVPLESYMRQSREASTSEAGIIKGTFARMKQFLITGEATPAAWFNSNMEVDQKTGEWVKKPAQSVASNKSPGLAEERLAKYGDPSQGIAGETPNSQEELYQ